MQKDKNSENEKTSILDSQQWGTTRLRFLFLVPMSMVIAVVIVILNIILYKHTSHDVEEGVIDIRASVEDFYEESIRYDAKALQAVIYTLRLDDGLVTALAQKDRESLLRRATPLFEDVRRNFNITHFYFTSIDRVNILRVHAPLRYGDTINRITMNQAQKSGTMAYGVELGPLGTFTLRVVSPWYNQAHQLIGYVELGMEIDHVINKLQKFFDVQVFTIINKKYLNQKNWEAGMRAMGRNPHWERFAKIVTSELSSRKFPPHIVEHLVRGESIINKNIIDLTHRDLSYRITSLPLHDAGGRDVAEMLLVTDVSQEEKFVRNTLYMGTITAIIAGTMLFAFFYWLVGKIGSRIEYNEKKLREIATRDGLTGLYNHKYFYTLLESELVRTKRYERDISLLLLDIDFFKKVNDTYGHRSGDMILSGFSERLMSRVRSTDSVCRYGGEEITIILPETDTTTAQEIAENLRILIEQEPFEIENGEFINITVSVGVSSYCEDIQEASNLVSGADSALYEAKENGRNRVSVYKPKGQNQS